MSIAARKAYVGVPRDSVDNFNGKQLVYVSWDHHLLFASSFMLCLPPQMTFGELIEGVLKLLLAPDPDANAIDWSQVQWLKSNQPWVPDLDRSLADNGISHKAHLRMHTPGLNTLCEGAQP